MSQPKYCYVMDSSALIDLDKSYPMDMFDDLWNNEIVNLIKDDLFKSPEEVFKELQDDTLVAWAKKHKKMFKPLDESKLQKPKR